MTRLAFKSCLFAGLVVLGVEHRPAKAQQSSTTQAPADNVIVTKEYPFTDGVVYSIQTAPGRITDIVLQTGETLGAVASGDTARWVIGDTTSGSGDTARAHVLIKPIATGLSTNVVITTDRRVYRLDLKSGAHDAMAAVAWTYPQDALISLRKAAVTAHAAAPVASGVEIDRLRFDYVISGDRPSWRPIRAFDDGRQTFIEFPPTLGESEVPPLFLVGPQGEAQLVNYRLNGRHYVIDRLFDIAELRLGTRKQTVVRITRSGDNQSAIKRRRGS